MADPNFAACMEMIAFAADVMDKLESYTSTASTGLLATTEALRNDLEEVLLQDRSGREGFHRDTAEPLTLGSFDLLLQRCDKVRAI